jgi:Tfp pilus assembly protein PilE
VKQHGFTFIALMITLATLDSRTDIMPAFHIQHRAKEQA